MVNIGKIFDGIGVKRIAHVAIAVKSLEDTAERFSILLGKSLEGVETLTERGLKIGFFKVGESSIELIEPLDSDNTISRFIERRGEGLHHLALEVEDINKALKILKERKIRLVDSEPRKGAHNSLIAFVHPDSSGGVLVELVQR